MKKVLTVLTKLKDVEAVVIAMLKEFVPTEVVLIVAVFSGVEVAIVVVVEDVVVVAALLLSTAIVVVVVFTA